MKTNSLENSHECSFPKEQTEHPFFIVTFLTLVLMAEMIASLFLVVYGTHQQNAGSSLIPLAITNLAISTGCDSFITESLVHNSVLSFHQTWRSYQAMVFINLCWPFLVVTYLSSMLTATDSSFL